MDLEEISYNKLKKLLVIGLIILIVGVLIQERHILGIGIGFVIMDIIFIYLKRKN